jgi:hypothetical protein
VLALLPTQRGWFWETADTAVTLLLVTYVVLLGTLATRRLYVVRRRQREERAKRRLEHLLEQLERESSSVEIAAQVGRLDELERPIAAGMLLARFDAADEDEHRRLVAALEQSGAIELMLRGLRRLMPWRKALAAQLLGQCRATKAVPALIALTDSRSLQVRDAAVVALGRIGDPRALPVIEQLFLRPRRRVSSGVRFEALLGLPAAGAGQVFAEALGSPDPRVRGSACVGVALVLGRSEARELVAERLSDSSPMVRAAAADALARVGGDDVPSALAAAVTDSEVVVRRAAVRALAMYDDPEAVELGRRALHDPDREVVIHAGETLVKLSRCERAGGRAWYVVAAAAEWPVRRALVIAEVSGR